MKTFWRSFAGGRPTVRLAAIAIGALAVACCAADPPAKPAAQAQPASPSAARSDPTASDPAIEQALGARLGQTETGQPVVTQLLRGGLAHRHGIRPGDEIVSINGRAVAKLDDVRQALNAKPAGQNVKLVVRPAQRTHLLRIAGKPADGYEDAKTHPVAMLGVTLNNVARKVSVVQFYAGGPADKAAIRTGDVILAVDGQKIFSRKELYDLLAKHKPGDSIALRIFSINGEVPREVKVTLGSRAEVLDRRLVTRVAAPPPPTETIITGDDWIDPTEAAEISDPYLRALDTDFDG